VIFLMLPWQNGRKRQPEGEPVETNSEQDELIAMRYLFLYQAGMPEEHAAVLAQDLRIDWHEAVKLLDKGCEPALIIDILS
jgi:hypothetical protein